MKKIYTLILTGILVFSLQAQEQDTSSAVLVDAGTCIDFETGLLHVKWNVFDNCPEAEGDLTTLTEIGWHSGANEWANVVAWDDENALTATDEDGDGVFEAEVDIVEYYGIIALEDLFNIKMVFNQGPGVPDAPWDSAGRDPVPDGGVFSEDCGDLRLVVTDPASSCASTSTFDPSLQNSISISPMPFSESAVLKFYNPENALYDLSITDLSGKVIRSITGITGEQVRIERTNMPAGIFIGQLRSEDGKFASVKLVIR